MKQHENPVRLLNVILLQGCYLKTATDCTYVYFILSSVFYVIVAVCQLLIKDFLILILILMRAMRGMGPVKIAKFVTTCQ